MSEQCPARQKLNILDADGTSRTVHQCIEPTSPSFAHTVEPSVCDACPARAAAVTNAKRGQPPKPEKVKTPLAKSQPPKSEKDCADVKQVVKVKCCGEVTRTNYCTSVSSVLNGKVVTQTECSKCPVRRVAS